MIRDNRFMFAFLQLNCGNSKEGNFVIIICHTGLRELP